VRPVARYGNVRLLASHDSFFPATTTPSPCRPLSTCVLRPLAPPPPALPATTHSPAPEAAPPPPRRPAMPPPAARLAVAPQPSLDHGVPPPLALIHHLAWRRRPCRRAPPLTRPTALPPPPSPPAPPSLFSRLRIRACSDSDTLAKKNLFRLRHTLLMKKIFCEPVALRAEHDRPCGIVFEPTVLDVGLG
jgi:hypothetical protein